MTKSHMADWIYACNACAVACNFCAASCLAEDNVKAMATCIALDIDCAAMCQLAAAAMSRQSTNAAANCGLCATLCAACATECVKHSMEHCQRCADACRSCVRECQRIAQETSSGAH